MSGRWLEPALHPTPVICPPRKSSIHPPCTNTVPQPIENALHQAKKLEWWTIVNYIFDATILFLVLGNSQAMKASWVQDLLAFLPPIAFLIAVKVAAQRPTQEHPYGLHRSVGIAHLVAASALFSVGAFLLVTSASTLIKVEHPSVGGIDLLGHTIWLGWLMIAVLVITGVVPILLGIKKMKLAGKLHDKVLYADAEMNRPARRRQEPSRGSLLFGGYPGQDL